MSPTSPPPSTATSSPCAPIVWADALRAQAFYTWLNAVATPHHLQVDSLQ